MSAFLLSDIHLGCHVLELDKWLEVAKDYFKNFMFPILRNKYKRGDRLYILGDVFDNRSHIDIKVIGYAYDIFDELEAMGVEVHILLGNHDMRSERSYEFHSLRILRGYSNITVYTKPTVIEHHGKRILMMPYVTDKKEELSILREYTGKVDYLFCHSDLSGAKTNMKTVLEHGLSIADFAAFPKVFSGHIHIQQKTQNFTYIGSPYHMDRNDRGNRKGLYILDLDGGTEEFIPNTLSPEFKVIEILEESDIAKIDRYMNGDSENQKDWVDMVISNTLIMQNKELNQKMQEVTRSRKVLKLTQVDDITIKDTVQDVDMDDIGFGYTIEDYIREYVGNQEVEPDIKSRIISELEDVIRIYSSSKK
jgi:DNA repair exonuclease SbcCD nuclease subunit